MSAFNPNGASGDGNAPETSASGSGQAGNSAKGKGKASDRDFIDEMDIFTCNVDALLERRFDEFEARLLQSGIANRTTLIGGTSGEACDREGTNWHEVEFDGKDVDPVMKKGGAKTKGKPRRATGRRSENVNFFNSDLRAYLKSLQLIFIPDKGQPKFASEDELRLFAMEGDGTGPEIPNTDDGAMHLEWTKHFLSSEWNKRAFILLTEDFHANLQRGKDRKDNDLQCTYIPKFMTAERIRSSIVANLKTVNAKVTKDPETLKLYLERAAIRGRANTRRRTRRKIRKQIIDCMVSDDTPITPDERALWKATETAVDILDVDGTSADETDAEETKKAREKVVRRLDQPFLCPEIVELKAAIDSYEQFLKDEEGNNNTKQGNRPLRRIRDAISKDSRNFMERLPVNFYNAAWYKPLSPFQKREVAAGAAVAIPHINRYVSTV